MSFIGKMLTDLGDDLQLCRGLFVPLQLHKVVVHVHFPIVFFLKFDLTEESVAPFIDRALDLLLLHQCIRNGRQIVDLPL